MFPSVGKLENVFVGNNISHESARITKRCQYNRPKRKSYHAGKLMRENTQRASATKMLLQAFLLHGKQVLLRIIYPTSFIPIIKTLAIITSICLMIYRVHVWEIFSHVYYFCYLLLRLVRFYSFTCFFLPTLKPFLGPMVLPYYETLHILHYRALNYTLPLTLCVHPCPKN